MMDYGVSLYLAKMRVKALPGIERKLIKNVDLPVEAGQSLDARLTLNNRGVPLENLRNVLFALRHAPEWQGVLAYDAFATRVITQEPTPRGRMVEEWADEHDTVRVSGSKSRGFRRRPAS
jgi:hypothetical protein